ncbi:hypothetical protein L211DRAFT_667843 [Terfezia boudieri ATCC MYA-4762]|uniref:Uncharacterized protein n=1 Tax=Terfezia boudieri ATCC MYA-4762 TaxID=1051890 RepID=A0A3N4L811_9PEZI|nr:hypothetical protein L211DRAFT_667843 [Terfezia boudieri ATCC MYA-4762]
MAAMRQSLSNPQPIAPATERVILALLRPYIRLLCLSEPQLAYDEHNSFVGKQRLKESLMSQLPMQELEDVGFNDLSVRVLLNEMLRSREYGLTEELILEAKRRKDGTNMDGMGELSPIVGNMAEVNPQAYKQTTPLPIDLQNQLLTLLQQRLEFSCYEFVRSHYPSIFWRKPAWETSPLAAELTHWIHEISRELRKYGTSYNGTTTDAVNEIEDLISILRELNGVRHDSVHRNNVDMEKILKYVRLGSRVISIFRGWTLSAHGPIQKWNDRDLIKIQRELGMLEGELETIMFKFHKGKTALREKWANQGREAESLQSMEMVLQCSEAEEVEELLRRLTWKLWEFGNDNHLLRDRAHTPWLRIYTENAAWDTQTYSSPKMDLMFRDFSG